MKWTGFDWIPSTSPIHFAFRFFVSIFSDPFYSSSHYTLLKLLLAAIIKVKYMPCHCISILKVITYKSLLLSRPCLPYNSCKHGCCCKNRNLLFCTVFCRRYLRESNLSKPTVIFPQPACLLNPKRFAFFDW